MPNFKREHNLLIIADDFTGANDTGVQLAKKGAVVEVVFALENPFHSHADVIVINTESRAKTMAEAQHDVAKAITLNPAKHIYKKIDSTFRGHVGAEIEAAMNASQARIALVAAAIPVAGRVTRQGYCYVDGKPLLETEFATDPKTPIHSSRIKAILASQTKVPIYEINLATIRSDHLLNAIHEVSGKDKAIIVLDAETDADLDNIGHVLPSIVDHYILVGAAGFANALPQSLYQTAYQTAKYPLPVLVVAGSMSQATRKQITFAAQENSLEIIDIDIEDLMASPPYDNQPRQQLSRIHHQAVNTLGNKRHCVLRTCRDDLAREKIPELCQKYNLTRQQLGHCISDALGKIVALILQDVRVGGLFLTGGDIAIAVAQALGAQGYRINAEVLPCIPCGTFINSDIGDLPVITKAGGFGSETVLRDSLFFIEEMYRDK